MNTNNTRTLAFRVNGLEMKATFDKTVKRAEDMLPDYRGIHEHINYEVFIVTSGELTLISEEGGSTYRSSILTVPPRFKHFSVSGGEVTAFFVTPSRQSEKEELMRFEEALPPDKIAVMPLSADTLAFSEGLVHSLNSDSGCSEQRATAYLELIFSDLLEHLGVYGLKKGEGSRDDSLFSVMEDFVNHRYSESVGLKELSARLGLSSRQTARVVRRLYSEPLSSVIKNKRLTVAAALLKNTSKTVTDIAEEVGYASQSRFYCDFKKRYGITPKSVRRHGKT
jgi:AraC-like DNA-binding protein